MEITFSTPALLFPAISLVMLANTNRFLALASVVRALHDRYKADKENTLLEGQIRNLRRRIILVRHMQFLGMMSFLAAILCICLILAELQLAAKLVFVLSILLFAVSLVFSLMEIMQSTKALEIELGSMEKRKP